MSEIGKETKTKVVQVKVKCKACKGSKVGPGKTKPPCTKCKGVGEVTIEREIEA